VLAFVDVGSPIFFWQQRIGQHGRTFLLYKVRTLRPPFDWMGQSMPEDKRLSWIGAFLRKTRLDEFPQLLNVLVGDMSLIGPRPLLPQDQPENPAIRLTIRPGLTGWAQVNGGVSLSPKVKNELDEWYVRNASPALDLRIMFMTMRFLFTGEHGTSPAATARGGGNSER
jgi:lipopolysaccharide/colanic/teichoic acid biosynthesis glycosyltransferase